MSKISSAYTSGLHRPSSGVSTNRPSSCNHNTIAVSNPLTSDRITLSEAGLAAAARFSQMIPRSGNTYTPALPAPKTDESPATSILLEKTSETPTSRNMVRRIYTQQQESSSDLTSSPATRLDILV